MGFPGNVEFTAVYSLKGGTLRLEITARTDRKTPINVVQHQYFNLGTTDDVLDHSYWFAINAITEVDGALIPTGNIIETKPGTQWYFRQPKTLRDSSGAPIG